MVRVATAAGGDRGKVICFRCRRACGEGGCRCGAGGLPGEARRGGATTEVSAAVLGAWLGAAALAGSLLGAALALLH